jgi:hypothetical protein
MKAVKDVSRLDTVTGFSKMTPEAIETMNKLNLLLRDGEK